MEEKIEQEIIDENSIKQEMVEDQNKNDNLPDENQKKDAHQFDFRLYGDSHVLDNKKAGIYVHKKAS